MRQPPANIIAAAQAAARVTRIPASVTLAQWAIESGWGEKVIGKNNFFNIRCLLDKHGMPTQPGTLGPTTEFIGGKKTALKGWFRDYASIEESFNDHGRLISSAKVYAPAMAALPDRDRFIDLMGPKYATAPGYAQSLKDLIKSNKLDKFDGGAA